MADDIWNKKRENLEKQLTDAALELFDHMGGAGACVFEIPNTAPTVSIMVGDNKAMVSLTDELKKGLAGGIENRSEISHKILSEINKAIQNIVAPGDIDLLCIVGSYGDTMGDDEILELLQQYNETGSSMKEIFCAVGDTPEIRRKRMKLITPVDKEKTDG